MATLSFLTIPQQVAQHLRAELALGRWDETMPGKHHLAQELAITHQTVEAALQQLEIEGLLVPQGAGRPRRIVRSAAKRAKRPLRIGLLLWDEADRALDYVVDLQHRLTEAGHIVIDPRKTLMEMKMEVKRVASLVKKTTAEAWVVMAGSLAVLEWFVEQKIPTFAVFGRVKTLPIAASGPANDAALFKATRSLIDLGHGSIVLLVRAQHRRPTPGVTVSKFLATLEACGIRPSPFNVPDWEETAAGLQACLAALFKVTPPTALIFDEALHFFAAGYFLAARGLRVPQDVSLICMEENPVTAWCVPNIATIRVDYSGVTRYILSWVKNISQGKKDVRQHLTQGEYVPGGTVGPVRQG